MRIEVAVEQERGLRGRVRVIDVAEPSEAVEFVGWLGLIHALSRCLEPLPRDTSAPARPPTN